MPQLILALVIGSLFSVLPAASVAASCSAAKLTEIHAAATRASSHVYIDCDLSKRLILQGSAASGSVVDCHKAAVLPGIEIKPRGRWNSSNNDLVWDRPENITVRNCHIKGSVEIEGMAKAAGLHQEKNPCRQCRKGEEPPSEMCRQCAMWESSRRSGHAQRVRENAPRAITLENLTIEAQGAIPLWIGPGVTQTVLRDSTLTGTSNSVAVYLEAESYNNTFDNNKFHTKTGREVMAIDASASNRIMNNWFSALSNGGIYLYRNCGEGATVRHTTPSHNQIINNIFYYNRYRGGNPSVYIASRNGKTRKGKTAYCSDDKGHPYGSSASDLDYARHNVVMQNQIYKRSVDDMIKVKNALVNSPNYIGYNKTVSPATVVKDRLAGCFVPDGYQSDFITHGNSVDVFRISEHAGAADCSRYKYTCRDGALSASREAFCRVTKASFDCKRDSSNKGCQKTVSCPSGKRIVGAVAACNLEYGTVSSGDLAKVPVNNIKVLRTSDKVSQGLCSVGHNGLRENNSLHTGQRMITGINGQQRVTVSCKEHDKNGGDCHIKGTLYCSND